MVNINCVCSEILLGQNWNKGGWILLETDAIIKLLNSYYSYPEIYGFYSL